ncbi:elongation factor Ts [Candidatus Roizmanbacteria bacterium]|nr:elongation factor Ts [Candidatus Roizmanbacteria bacterium]
MDITKLKQLREETGISFSLCKKALEESKNNIDAAKKLLTKWGAEKIKDKQGRSTFQGGLFSYVHHNKKLAVLVELLCETDFVAGNVEFLRLGTEISMQVASVRAENVKELLQQDYIRDPSKKIEDLIKDAVLKFGENIKIARFVKWNLGN